jgi:hypothetical protein
MRTSEIRNVFGIVARKVYISGIDAFHFYILDGQIYLDTIRCVEVLKC